MGKAVRKCGTPSRDFLTEVPPGKVKVFPDSSGCRGVPTHGSMDRHKKSERAREGEEQEDSPREGDAFENVGEYTPGSSGPPVHDETRASQTHDRFFIWSGYRHFSRATGLFQRDAVVQSEPLGMMESLEAGVSTALCALPVRSRDIG